MEFRIADTLTNSLKQLTNQEQKAVKTTAFDLQMNPAQASLKFHKLDRLKDARFWSVSVNRDLRLIIHKTDTSLLLCYVDHHDDAYAWARKRKIERHPRTGVAQIVEVRETVFNGPPPQLEILSDSNQEIQTVAKWIKDCLDNGFQPYEIGVFVRETQQLERAKSAIELAQANSVELDHQIIPTSECIAVSTMHLAKGMEFRAVVVMACDDEVIPLQERIETVADEADLEEVYRTERHLLYVACTRARDRLLVTGVDPASEFLEDIET